MKILFFSIPFYFKMSQLVERKGFKIESTLPKKKKNKEKKIKPVEQVKIIDDDAPIPWNSKKSSAVAADDELASFEDAPVVVGKMNIRRKTNSSLIVFL